MHVVVHFGLHSVGTAVVAKAKLGNVNHIISRACAQFFFILSLFNAAAKLFLCSTFPRTKLFPYYRYILDDAINCHHIELNVVGCTFNYSERLILSIFHERVFGFVMAPDWPFHSGCILDFFRQNQGEKELNAR